MNRDSIIGTWRLLSFDLEDEKGGLEAWGDSTQGLLIYTKDGHMSVSINRSCSKLEDSEAVLDSILFYSGTYKVMGSQVFHAVQVASDPNRVGKEMIREIRILETKDKPTIQLISPMQSSGRSILCWEKVVQ